MSAAPAMMSTVEWMNPILHVDADAFFTSVEQALRPQLRGRPVVTGKERGIVACASYEAKALGVKRPMRLLDAKAACPDLVCLPSDYETYSVYSTRIFSIIRRFTPMVEEYSIDEAFAELSGLRRLHRMDFPGIAWKIKQTIQQELGLTVSAGLSASKTLAKIASHSRKPDGFAVLRANELHTALATVPLKEVCGFGPNTVALLQKHGLQTVLDYVSRPEAWAKRLLGKIGVELWHELRGEAVYPLQTGEPHDYITISKCKTFTPPSGHRDFVRAQLIRNLESAFMKLRRHRLRAHGVILHLRDQGFRSRGIEVRLDRSTSSTIEVTRLVLPFFEQLFQPGTKYRLTGVTLFKLEPDREVQYLLFDDVPKIESLKALDRAIDEVRSQYGKHTLQLGTGLWLRRQKQHLSERGDVPARRKALLPGETERQRLGIPLWQLDVGTPAASTSLNGAAAI